MKYRSELDVKKALGIDSFRNLSRDNVMRFAAMMPDMDKEVALKVIEQFPEFKAFALDAVNVMQKAHESSLAENRASQDQAHQAWQDVREILRGQLDGDELPWEEKRYIIDLIVDTARQEAAKDTENKQFIKDLAKYTLTAVGAAVVLAVVYVGGKIGLEQLGGDNELGS